MSCFRLQKCDLENTNTMPTYSKLRKKQKLYLHSQWHAKNRKKREIYYILFGRIQMVHKEKSLFTTGGHPRGHNLATLALSHFFFYQSVEYKWHRPLVWAAVELTLYTKKISLYNNICLIKFHIYIWVDALHININQLYKDAEFALLEASPEII